MTNPDALAYPFQEQDLPGCSSNEGLTKRELFSAMAMQGFCSNANNIKSKDKQVTPEEIARISVVSADALIAQLNQNKE